ncbi:hypothetical protein BDA96_01G377400 [Sorghum bicolor]|uniref:Bifunctional inhibitor/plant lipid transfer protein/seed storage helical domain-containing protein n=2 Tax=Sorghum bicolor TaxID=4558 RepID=A0A921UZW8_SORBI|nr:non-specific lipid transfer protein-like 1 [Sorghum bicolor]KAG0550899.1 hypothetical protein BDA96_01G377400 [Sorghum bicolor]OQU92502.1 hypothetical protein SORBI_3001G353501 [Sorghum bicolor]|eukprot:XP_002467775.1 non-specific lipid transfer protein-like 1 [Sorghum bicolor]
MALASRAAAMACVLLALAASAAGAGSHSPAPAPAVDCVTQATTLIDCLDYVQPGSTAKRPSAACCAEVKTAVASPAIVGCLCSLAGNKDLGIPIDMKRVLALPGACGASNAAFSKCNISALSPAGAPAPSSTAGGSSSGGAAASPPKAAAASSPMTATALVAAVAAPLLAYFYLF